MSQNKKTFTLKDLELDQVVETRDGYWFIVCKTKEGVVLSGEHGWINPYELYADDLTDVDGDYENDIMKVWDITDDGENAHAVSPENRELLWEREEDDEEDEDYENEEAAIKLSEELTNDFMTHLGKEFGMSDEEIEATKKEAKEAADRELAKRKKPCVKVNVDVDAEFEDMMKDLDDIMFIASAMTRLNEKYGM